MINKILITNRGEIAVRIIRSCQELDIDTVAVYSDADRISPHVLKATEAYHIGPAPSNESYLNIPRLFEVIKKSGADAVHPGYGFLSENAGFADTLKKSGIIWIGPPSDAIKLMGDKMAARSLAEKINAPIIPGTKKPLSSTDNAITIAENIGFPVLVKAAGGGGGKGMRIVNSSAELENAFNRAKSEAINAFSDDRIYIEKYLEEPHHIEIQVFADTHGNAVSLGERECSVQRRYQKIIEETPSPFINEQLRQKLSATAVKITKACGYIGAGTVEFLVDKNYNYYFLEMNTRLQVEHPVTEMVTGFDLVKEQINVANGNELSFCQEDIQPTGNAIECRIYAENGFNNFAPSIGKILELDIPLGFGVRLDEGVRNGQEITPYYDPLLGKLVTWGNNRLDALNRMKRALLEFHVVGIDTTIPFCLSMIQHPTFQSGNYCTKTLDEIKDELINNLKINAKSHSLAASISAIQKLMKDKPKTLVHQKSIDKTSLWLQSGRGANIR